MACVGVSGAFVEVVHDQGKEEREQEGPQAPCMRVCSLDLSGGHGARVREAVGGRRKRGTRA